jgi:hypothetical protein
MATTPTTRRLGTGNGVNNYLLNRPQQRPGSLEINTSGRRLLVRLVPDSVSSVKA